MPTGTTVKLVCLYEDEIRKAAKMLKQCDEVFQDESSTADQRSEALNSALQACFAVLYGAEEEGAVVMMAARELFLRARETSPATSTKGDGS